MAEKGLSLEGAGFQKRTEKDAALADAWEEGYEASDHEAYHFSTHGRTDNPYQPRVIPPATTPASDADPASDTEAGK